MLAWNGGAHANPTFAGDTLYAWTDVLAKADLSHTPRAGALRLRLVAVKN
jgi:2-methylfumaryl-CoA hydratase